MSHTTVKYLITITVTKYITYRRHTFIQIVHRNPNDKKVQINDI